VSLASEPTLLPARLTTLKSVARLWSARPALLNANPGAFNNIQHKRLLHNLKKRRIPDFMVKWIGNFLSDRHTQMRFNGTDTEKITIDAGVPQGYPISPILYLFYNVDLLDVPGSRGLSLGFIDDIAYGVQGESDVHNARELERMLIKAEKWREGHGARFETTKYVLTHFTRSRTTPTANITITGTTIEPSQEARYLGVIFDRKLHFAQHIQHAGKRVPNSRSPSPESRKAYGALLTSNLGCSSTLLLHQGWTMLQLSGIDQRRKAI